MFNVLFVGCNISSGNSLEVVSQSTDYNAVGEYRCRNNGVLFYSNKTRLISNKTKCLATAQWRDYNVVQCWTGKCWTGKCCPLLHKFCLSGFKRRL